MDLAKIAAYLIYTHAFLGGVSLLSGAIALMVKKGNNVHRKSGKVFYVSMLISAISALIISVLPKHENPFLFAVGVFSTYFLIGGVRSLQYKEANVNLSIDKIIAYLITLTGIAMILFPIIAYSGINIILLVFGIASSVIGVSDIILFKNKEKNQKSWLRSHAGKMTGGYLAAVSAFFVVNNILPGVWNWFVPGILGSVYITYWMRKLS